MVHRRRHVGRRPERGREHGRHGQRLRPGELQDHHDQRPVAAILPGPVSGHQPLQPGHSEHPGRTARRHDGRTAEGALSGRGLFPARLLLFPSGPCFRRCSDADGTADQLERMAAAPLAEVRNLRTDPLRSEKRRGNALEKERVSRRGDRHRHQRRRTGHADEGEPLP